MPAEIVARDAVIELEGVVIADRDHRHVRILRLQLVEKARDRFRLSRALGTHAHAHAFITDDLDVDERPDKTIPAIPMMPGTALQCRQA
jgi:hypothetical protein